MEFSAEVEYYCARDHVTRVPFTATALLDAPAAWSCQQCGQTAKRTKPKPEENSKPAASVFPESHHQEVQARRSAAEAEKILSDALEKIRTKPTD